MEQNLCLLRFLSGGSACAGLCELCAFGLETYSQSELVNLCNFFRKKALKVNNELSPRSAVDSSSLSINELSPSSSFLRAASSSSSNNFSELSSVSSGNLEEKFHKWPMQSTCKMHRPSSSSIEGQDRLHLEY